MGQSLRDWQEPAQSWKDSRPQSPMASDSGVGRQSPERAARCVVWPRPGNTGILVNMQRDKRWVAVLVAGFVVATLADNGGADKPPEIFPLEKVRRGQKGYGLTTFQGTKPERFEFEVVGVAKKLLPKMDIILVKSEDPKFNVTGFWRGMSGSPLFIDGKLACAYAYGWRFNKVALGGCTPIGYMVKEGFVPQRKVIDGMGTTRLKGKAKSRRPANARLGGTGKIKTPIAAATIKDWLRVAPERTVDSALKQLGEPRKPWLMRAPLPPGPQPAASSGRDEDGLVAASVPLAMSGFSAGALDQAKALFGDYPLSPMRGGGSGNPHEGPSKFALGSSLSVLLARGDMSMAATGTVSYVDGARVLGFGHPLFQVGEFYAPVTAAEVHTVLPSQVHAFVMASPMRELGSLVQDRQSTIMADTRLETSMIPFDIYVDSQGVDSRGGKGSSSKGEFHVELLNSRFFTGSFAGMAAFSAISHYLPDRDHATVYMESTVHVKGHKPLSFVDYLYADDGVGSVIGSARGLRVLVPLLNNPFSPVEIERVELRAKIRYEVNFGTIDELRLARAELVPGKRAHVEVTMTTYDGKRIVQKVPFDVPKSLAGSIIRVQVSAGDSATLDAAPPKSLDDLMKALGKLLPGNVFAVTLLTANEGVAIDGKLVRDLPASAVDKLHPRSRTQRANLYRPLARSTYPSKRVINGSKAILVKVADE